MPNSFSHYAVEHALNVLLDIRAETTDPQALERVNAAITATHKILEPEIALAAIEIHRKDGDPHNNDLSNLEPRPRIGTRVESRRTEGYGIPGTVVGWDPDLKLPLIDWRTPWATVGPEACEPHEYAVTQEDA